MLNNTKTAVMAVLRTDPSITPERMRFICAAMNGDPAAATAATATGDELLRPAEVAALIRRSRKTVHQLARRGVFRRVYAPHGRHALGISAESVRAFLRGEADTQKEGEE